MHSPAKNNEPVDPAAVEAARKFVNEVMSKGVIGLIDEYKGVFRYVSPKAAQVSAFKANEKRNRSGQILCFDETRVKLQSGVPPETDYIHANVCEIPDVDSKYIVTQIPMANTINDFWRMIFDESTAAIFLLMNNECMPAGFKRFWPTGLNKVVMYGEMSVCIKKQAKEDRFEMYTLEVLPEGCSNSVICKMFIMTDFHHEHGSKSSTSVLRLMRNAPKASLGPVVVQCLYGVGPSSVILMLAVGRCRIARGKVPVMQDIVREIREFRFGLVICDEQYIFAVIALAIYANCKYMNRDQMEGLTTLFSEYRTQMHGTVGLRYAPSWAPPELK